MRDLISVVVPVYNVEKYLKESLDSIVNQTYHNLQIILVDDGSTDNSGAICDKYAEKDDRITVIHQKNEGAGSAKNTGLKYVKGDYLSIIDSDDYIEKNMYEKMLHYMKENDAEIVQCNLKFVFANGVSDVSWVKNHKEGLINKQTYFEELLSEWKCAIFWNKLFKTKLLKDTLFPTNRKIDDEFFTYRLIFETNRIFNVKDVFYNYRMRKSSVMNDSDNSRLISDRVDCFVERYEFISKNEPVLKKAYYNHLSDLLVFFYNQAVSDELKKKLVLLMKEYPNKKPSVFIRAIRWISNKSLSSEKEPKNTNLIYFD